MPLAKFCANCGNKIDEKTSFCSQCGAKRDSLGSINSPERTLAISEKSGLTTFLLCLFLGTLGIHRFYVGKIGTGILMLLTSGGLGIWYLYDLINIVCNNFTDKAGNTVEITRKPSTGKTVAMVVGSIVAAFILFFGTLITIIVLCVSCLTDVVQNQFSALRAGDYEKAYSYTASEFKKEVSIHDFKQFIEENPALKDNVSVSFPSREIKNNYGFLNGTLQLKDGKTIPIEVQLIKEDNVWKIIYIDLKPTEMENNAEKVSEDTTLSKVFENKKYKFTIQYPAAWDYQQADLQSVDFSWKSSREHPYYAQVNIQVIPSKKAGGLYATTRDVVDSLKSDIKKETQHAAFLASGEMELPNNSHKFSGEYFITTYTYQGEPMKKMQIILMEKDSEYIYSWGFTASADYFDDDLPIAKAMYESWEIN